VGGRLPQEKKGEGGGGGGGGGPETAAIVSKYRDGIRKKTQPVLRELYCV